VKRVDNPEQAPKFDGRKRNGRHPKSRKNLIAPRRPGESGNPSGKPGYDVSAFIARRAFEDNQAEIYKSLATNLVSGDIQAFRIAADRGFGSVTERHEHSGPDGGPITFSEILGTMRIRTESAEEPTESKPANSDDE
jgi:hypothetical protein